MIQLFLYRTILPVLLLSVSCNKTSFFNPGKIWISSKAQSPQITRVNIENDQVIVLGSNLLNASKAQVEGNTNHTFTIESRSENRLILNARSALSLLVGGAFNLIISNAAGAATYPITFEIQNGQVTAAKLHNMGATSGQFLRYNGTSWGPASMQSSLIYTGTYNATTDTPDISAAGGPAGTFYIVTTGGTQNLGSGPETFAAGDWAIFDGTNWSKVPMSGNSVSSFNGRMGVVVPLANDYSWGMLSKTSGKLTGSKISDIADVVVTGIQDGDVLSWDQPSSQWVAAPPAMTIAAGSVTSTEIASGAVDSTKIVDGTIVNADISATAAIAQSKIQNLTTDLAAKEAAIAAGTTLQYYRGDKSWQTLNTTAVAEGTNLYFLDSRVRAALMTGYSMGTAVPIDVTDTLMQALGKLEAQIAANSGGYWSKTGSIVYYTGGNVGIGNSTAGEKLVVTGNSAVSSKMAIGQSSVNSSTYLHIKRDTGATGDENLMLDNAESAASKSSTILFATGGTGRARITGGLDASVLPILTFSADTTTPTEHMRITSAGNVGIGTTSPTLAALQVSKNGAASFSGLKLDGTWFTGGTSTTTKPHFLIEPTGTTSTSWSTFGTGLGVNAPSGFNGDLLNLQLAGNSSFKVNAFGQVTAGAEVKLIANSNPSLQFGPPGVLSTNNDVVGEIPFKSINSGWSEVVSGRIRTVINTVTSGAELSTMTLTTVDSGTVGDRITIRGSNVGISNSTPGRLLHVGSSAVSTGTAVANFQNVDGTCTITPAAAGSGIACSSDERLKENFKKISGHQVLKKIKNLQAYTYNFKTSSKQNRQTGYKAREVRDIAPEFVRENDDGFLQVYYDAFIPWITEALKTIINGLETVEKKQTYHERKMASIDSLQKETQNLKEDVRRKDQEIRELRTYLCTKDPQASICSSRKQN